MGTQAGHASSQKARLCAFPFSPDQHVSNDVEKHVEIGNKNVLADKAAVPNDLLSCARSNVVRFYENRADISSAFILRLRLRACAHGL